MGKTVKDGKVPDVKWDETPEAHDYPAALSYLSLITDGDTAAKLVARMRGATILHFKAKDILRAARLPLLEESNPHVASDLRKIASGESLSPILLVRGDLASDRRLQVADGYHRVCSCYHTDENIDIPCIVVPL